MSELTGSADPCDELEWTIWTEFQEIRPSRSELPKGEGFIRIRPIDTDQIIYLNLANSAMVNSFGEIIKYRQKEYDKSGPPLLKSNPAACLWTLHNVTGMEFEYSCAVSSYKGYAKKAARKVRKGHLAALLRDYRAKTGHSPLCNFIEMEPDLALTGMLRNISSPALPLKGEPADQDWMGLDWSELYPVGEKRFAYGKAGWFKVIRDGEVTYISGGQHLRGNLVPYDPECFGEGAMISVALHDESLPKYQVREILSDLFGGMYASTGRVPGEQFRFLSSPRTRERALSRGVYISGVTRPEDVHPRCEFGWSGY